MSTTVKVTGYLYAELLRYEMRGKKAGELMFTVLPYDNGDTRCWGAMVGPVSFDYVMPEGLDIEAETIRARVKALEAEKAEAAREYATKVSAINEQLARLTAITHEPEAA